MRLGGPLFDKHASPSAWVDVVRRMGYRSALCPVAADADDATIAAYRQAADEADIVIAEVGAWSNPISPDETVRDAAIDKNIAQLALADRIGARCCVNIPGSCNAEQWNGPHAGNYRRQTFERIVETVRHIIDAVRPTRTHYALEMMSWGIPDSAEQYLELIAAIDRPAFAAHLDPVNLLNCPRRVFENTALLEHTIRTLAPHIRSAHAKDVTLAGRHLVHIDECRPGTGVLDYPTYLRELAKLDPHTPLILEHLPDAEQYRLAAEHLRGVAQAERLAL